MLRRHPAKAHELVRSLVVGKLELAPRMDESGGFYEFKGTGTLLPLIAGAVPHNLASPSAAKPYNGALGVASPTGTDDLYTIRLTRWTPWKRAA